MSYDEFATRARLSGTIADTPYLILEVERLRANARAVQSALASLSPQIFYSMKANSHPALLQTLYEVGCGFDMASVLEMRRLLDLGLPLENVIFSSTVKVPAHVQEAAR